MLVNYLAAVGKGNEMPTELSKSLLTLLQTQLYAPNYEGGSIQVDVVDKGSDLKLLILDLTQEKVTEHKFLSLSCKGVEKESPNIILLLPLGANLVIIRVEKILEHGSQRRGEESELDLVKKAMRPLLQLISNGRIVVIGHKIQKHMRSLRQFFCYDGDDITGGRDRVYDTRSLFQVALRRRTYHRSLKTFVGSRSDLGIVGLCAN